MKKYRNQRTVDMLKKHFKTHNVFKVKIEDEVLQIKKGQNGPGCFSVKGYYEVRQTGEMDQGLISDYQTMAEIVGYFRSKERLELKQRRELSAYEKGHRFKMNVQTLSHSWAAYFYTLEQMRKAMFAEQAYGHLCEMYELLYENGAIRCQQVNVTNEPHYLKTVQPYYGDIKSGKKTFDIRFNDQDYQVGDILIFQEYDPEKNEYTGDELPPHEVTYLMNDPAYLKDGYVCMAIQLLSY